MEADGDRQSRAGVRRRGTVLAAAPWHPSGGGAIIIIIIIIIIITTIICSAAVKQPVSAIIIPIFIQRVSVLYSNISFEDLLSPIIIFTLALLLPGAYMLLTTKYGWIYIKLTTNR